MCSVVIDFTTMNHTSTELSQSSTSGSSEFYLLLIVVKLSVLLFLKVGRVLVRFYELHNKRVITKHDEASIARLQKLFSKTSDDLQAVTCTS